LSRKGGWRVLFNKKDFEHNFFVKPGAQRYSKSSSYFPSDLIRRGAAATSGLPSMGLVLSLLHVLVACRVESPVAPASCEDMLAIFKASKNDRPHHFNWQTKGLQADLQLHRNTRFDRSKELAIAYRKRLPWSIWASEYTTSYYRLSGNQGA
jgi:hypothetical protein